MERRSIPLHRDVKAVAVPSGAEETLKEGVLVDLVQRLGSSFTVCDADNRRFRIAGENADALGLPPPEPVEARASGPATEDAVLDVLREIYDPEIPVNVVELGLIYSCAVAPVGAGEGEGVRVAIEMTLTAPGCGMADVLKRDVEERVKALPGVTAVDVALVWDPPWTRDRMSEAARLELGLL